jgi:arginine/serine-rich splicing factor 7
MRVYVGNLNPNVDRAEVQREFQRFGGLADVWVARNPPGFAFLEFDDDHDAQDAVKEMDGREVFGSRVRVEISHASRGGNR